LQKRIALNPSTNKNTFMVSKELLKAGFRKLLKQYHEQPAPILVFNEKGELKTATKRALDLFGVENKTQLPIRKLQDLSKDPKKEIVLNKLTDAAANKKLFTKSTLLRIKTSGGFKNFLTEFSVNEDGEIHAHFTDVGEVIEKSGAITNIFGVTKEINSQKDLDNVFQKIAEQTASLFNAKVFVMQLEENNLRLKGLEGIPYTDAKKAELLDVNGGTLLALAARTRQIQEHPNIKKLPGATIQDIDIKHDFGHSIAIPLMAKNGNGEDTILGVIGLYKTGEDRFSPHEVELLKFLSEIAVTKISSTRLTEKLKHQATHDSLTKLLNRRGFFESMAEKTSLEGLDPNKTKVSEILSKLKNINPFRIVFVDLNNLKRVNDELGHLRGNEAIQLFADYLKQKIPNALVARMGGDEFAAFIPNTPNEDPEYSNKLEKQFKKLISKHADLNKTGFSAAFGHADFTPNPKHGKSVNWIKLVEEYAKSGKTLHDLSTYIVNAAERKTMCSKKAEKTRLGYAPPSFVSDLLNAVKNKKIGKKDVLTLLRKHWLLKKP